MVISTTRDMQQQGKYPTGTIQSEYPKCGNSGHPGDSEAYFGLLDLPRA